MRRSMSSAVISRTPMPLRSPRNNTAETSQLFHQPNHHYNMSSFTAWFFSIVTLNLRSQSGKPPSGIRMAPQQRLLAGTLQERPSRSARGPHQGAHRGRSRGVVHGHIRALRGTGVLSPPLSSVSGASVAARARSVLAPARPAAPGVGDGLQYNAYHVLGSLLQTSLDHGAAPAEAMQLAERILRMPPRTRRMLNSVVWRVIDKSKP